MYSMCIKAKLHSLKASKIIFLQLNLNHSNCKFCISQEWKSFIVILFPIVYTLGTHATPSDGSVMHSMLSSVGMCAEIPEQQMDAACGLAGSGPAYVSGH